MTDDLDDRTRGGVVTDERDLRAAALADPHRPAYHFTAPAGWLNDPNGAGQRGGEYHLFYQYNPYAAEHRLIHWGHAVSTDLVRWEDRPIALTPSEGPDAEGCWSGVLVDDGGRPVIMYSGHAEGRQTACLAYGDETLTTWTKEAGNPVIEPPADIDLTAFRDHCVWREGGRWRQLIGSGIRGKGGTAFLYESDDLLSWRPLGPLVAGDAAALPSADPAWTGTMWECVDFFRLRPDGITGPPDGASDDPHVLLFSAWDDGRTMHPLAAIGSYDGRRFEISRSQRLDLGGRHAYAPQSFADESGRRILWSWMQESRSVDAQREAGWSGAMALPRTLTLDASGVLRQAPVEELSLARGAKLDWAEEPGRFTSSGDQIEFALDADIPIGSGVEIGMLATADGRERTCLRVSRAVSGELSAVLDRSRSSLDDHVDTSDHAGAVPSDGDVVRIRGFVDRSSVEVFVDGIALTTRVYPTRPDARIVSAAARGRSAISTIEGWAIDGQEEPVRAMGTAPVGREGNDG